MSAKRDSDNRQKITDEIIWYNTQLPKMREIYETVKRAWQSYYSKQMRFLVHHHGPISERKIIETLIEKGIYQDEFSLINLPLIYQLNTDRVINECRQLLTILPETEFFELEISWDVGRNEITIKYSIKLLVHPNSIALSETNQ